MDNTAEKKVTQTVVSQASKALTSLLLTLADNPLSTSENDEEKLASLLRPWAEHIIHGGPSPKNRQDSGQRDWNGLIDFFSKFRGWEVETAELSLNSMREFIWQFLRTIGKDISANQLDTSTINSTMAKLQSALSGDSIDALKKEVATVVQILKDKSSEREKRYNEQLEMLGRRLKQMREELDRTKEKLGTDALTGIYNRAALDEHLHRILDIGILSGTSTCLLMIDIDNFKKINDTYGHQVGDTVLQNLSDLLKRVFPRKSDFVARYGGEEFTVIFAEDDGKIGKMLAEKLLKAVRETRIEIGKKKEIQITVSIGVAEKKSEETIDEWVKRADDALYKAKDLGRDMACLA